MLVGLGACSAARFDYTPDAAEQTVAFQDTYYLEYCAVSEIRMKHPFPPDLDGGPGGHAAFYLAGACRDTDAGYPVLVMCDAKPDANEHGAGISMDGNFRNANWMVTQGRDFFYDGGLAPGERVTPAVYARVQRTAQRMGLLDGIAFRPDLMREKPAGMSDADYRYDLSIGTDYALSIARGRYCARVPLSRAQMVRIVDFLNAKNALYRTGARDFDSSVFQDNCVHLPHNALAVADVWADWPTDQFLPFAILDFPVPKNDFVDLMRRTNDTRLDDLAHLFHDAAARRLVLEFGRLPAEPGALAASYPPHGPNDLFGDRLALIFYDTTPSAQYTRRLDTIFHDARYTDAAANLAYFDALYSRLSAARRPLAFWQPKIAAADRPAFARFYARYYARLGTLRAEIGNRGSIRLSSDVPAPSMSLRSPGSPGRGGPPT